MKIRRFKKKSPWVKTRGSEKPLSTSIHKCGTISWRLAPRMKCEFLDSPVPDLAHINLIWISAINLIDGTEIFQELARIAEFSDDLAV